METTGEAAGVKKRFYLHAAGTNADDAEMLATSGSVFCVERGGGDVPDPADLGYPVTHGLYGCRSGHREVMVWLILKPGVWRDFGFGTAPGPVHLLSPGGQSPQQRRDGAVSIHVRARAFQQDFRNPENVEVLFEALASTCLPESGYARAAGIFQSSGWGKSRTVCELWRKGVWVVYLSFASGTGYPEASSIKDWFLQELNQRLLGKPYMLGQLECMSFSLAYFVACLNQLNRLRKREKGITQVDFAGMLSKNGEEADRFWGGVREEMQNSLQIYEGLAPAAAAPGTAADAWALWQADASGLWGKALQDAFERNQKKFSVLFVFDEARHLLGKDSANPHMNAFVPVRRAAQAMDTYGVGMLLFMDTSSHASDFDVADKVQAHPSDRVAKGPLKLAPPIWASFSADVPQEEWEKFFPAERTFQYISRPEWYVRYGRPLWWAQFRSEMETVNLVDQDSIDAAFGMVCKLARDKLLGGGGAWSTYIGCDKGKGTISTEAALSLLGVRLAFDVDPRCRLASSMVANNLLTVVSVSPSREHLWTAWNVEPLVAKAAADCMQTLQTKGRSAELYGKLTEALVAGWIDKGYAGELVARIILLYAVDEAMGPRMYCSVDDFCRSLVKKEEVSLPGRLSAARLHFHAFRRVYKSADELTVEDFREAFERGYAIICCKEEAWGVDLYIPAFCGSDNEALTESNMTIIYGQVKLREDEPTKVCYAKISPQFAGLKVMKSLPYLSLYMNVMRKEGSSCTVVPFEDIEKAVRSSSQSPITRAVQELERREQESNRKGVSPARKKGKMHDKATDAWVNWLREVESNMQTVLAIKGLNAFNLDAELLRMLETVVEASKQIFVDGEASCRKLLELQRGQLSCMFPHLNIGNYK